MPTFYGDQLEISVPEFLNACSSSEKQELIRLILGKNRNQLNKSYKEFEKMSVGEELFEENLYALHGKWNVLSNEEENTIVKIAKRFKNQ